MKESFTYENMSIRCTSELDFRTYTQRTLVMQKVNIMIFEDSKTKRRSERKIKIVLIF